MRPVGTQFAVQPPILLTANIALDDRHPGRLHATAQANVAAAIQAFVGQPADRRAAAPLPPGRRRLRGRPSVTNVTGLAINDAGDLVPATSGIVQARHRHGELT